MKKYNDATFYKEVNYYKKELGNKVKDKVVFVVIKLKNKKAFYSIAPLSMAIHELDGEMQVIVEDSDSKGYDLLKEVWHVDRDYERRLKTKKVAALRAFINSVNKRTKTKVFKNIFKKPEILLEANEESFRGTFDLHYQNKWHKQYRWKELVDTCNQILTQGYDLKKTDKLSIGFVLVPKKEKLTLPLEDYLDSFSIAYATAMAAKKKKASASLGSSTNKWSLLARPVRTADLAATLKGCELDKNVDEEVFKKFKEFSKIMKLDRMKFPTAAFGIHAKGYFGKHFFGDQIGYPTLDKKTRWSSAGQMMLKDPYSPQTRLEKRDPMMRYGITETLPLDIFIETCNIDYNILRKRSEKIRDTLKTCEKIRVIGNHIDGYKTDFTVNLLSKKGEIKDFISSDCDVRTKIDQEFFEKTGIKAGAFANFPSGEAFVTPGGMSGIMVGDVVINVDSSYRLPKGQPIVVEFHKKGYKIIKAPKKIFDVMKRELKEARQKITDYEKSKSLPKEIVNIYKENFNLVGEFAINTNPKAKLCDYLIVNEKIARMIHVALGSGFEAHRKTLYHWDIVVDSPRQKLDIYGIDKNKKIHWIIKKGDFVI
jgi:leucyl aminopeptidase (aminopeptidase T)